MHASSLSAFVSLLLAGATLSAPVLQAQSVTAAAAPTLAVGATAPAFPADPAREKISAVLLLTAHAPEIVLVPALRGVVFVADATEVKLSPSPSADGIDVARAPLLRLYPDVVTPVKLFLGQPASLPSLERLAKVVQLGLQQQGESFATAYVPAQDLTDGVVRIVVTRARLEGDVAIEGAKYFSTRQYRAALSLASGAEIPAAALRAATDTLNQNPYRHVKASVSAGTAPGTSRIALQVEEQRPWQMNVGYNNAGSPSIGEDQLSAGFTWGNAFGRGDVFNYNFASDLSGEHMLSHSGGYTMFLPDRRALTVSGAWSRIVGDLPAPFAQTGHSWQVDARYSLPLRAPRAAWTQNLSFSADFKSSDNNLEFAAIPITNNETQIAQLGATYGVSFLGFGGQNSISVSGFASPGGVTRYNRSRAFDGSRPGAKADYAYGTVNLSHQQPLPFGCAWIASATVQFASGALLGSEQLAGAGGTAVRGYAESSAFGDSGVVVTNELHAPALPVFRGHDHLDLFAFVDFASLNLLVDRESTDLRSAGAGLNYSFGRHLSVRASYGWQLKYLDRSIEHSHALVSANVSY